MNDPMLTVLSLSVSGSVLALALLALKPLIKGRVSKAFAYYIWIPVLLRLVVPYSALFNIADKFIGSPAAVTQVITVSADDSADGKTDAQTAAEGSRGKGAVHIELPGFITENLFRIWAVGACAGMLWFWISNLVFSRRIRKSCSAPRDADIAAIRSLRLPEGVEAACSSLVSSPMLIGIFRPLIVLPQFAYVQNGMEQELKYAVLHELTHYKKRDIFYKWFVIAVTCAHWFNPLMLLLRREITRACELSCDEAVISGLTRDEKRVYGNTLLALSANGHTRLSVPATALCEDKKELKERLLSIMKHKKTTGSMIALSLILALGLTGCAAALGTYPVKDPESSKERPASGYSENTENVVLSDSGAQDSEAVFNSEDPVSDTSSGAGTGNTERTGTAAISFFDDQMKELTFDAGWYTLAPKTIVRITVDGDIPDRIKIYLTPSGTETADLQKEIASVTVGDNGSSDVELEFGEPVMGHLQAALEYGDRTVVTELYNVYFEGN
jgi:beta-lactamase regulating signal transducer with metallopeptidase domain